jgi:hypothetical protein
MDPAHAHRKLIAVALLASVLAGCEHDAVLRVRRMERDLSLALGRLKDIAGDQERFRLERRLLLQKLTEVQKELRGAEAELESAGRSAGFEPSRKNPGSIEVRFLRLGPVPELIDRLETLVLPRAARLRWVRCAENGCSFALGTIASVDRPREGLPADRRGSCAGVMPPRPWWRRHAAEWDRVEKLRQECVQLRASLAEQDLHDFVQLQADVRHLLDLLERDRQTPRILAAASVAEAVAAREFEVTWKEGDIRLAITDESREMRSHLERVGFLKGRDGAYTPRKKSPGEVLRGLRLER